MSPNFGKVLCLVTFICLTGVSVRSADWVVYDGKAGTGGGAGKHIVFLSGDEEYRGEEGLPLLAQILAERHNFKCTALFAVDPDGTINPDNRASLPGAEAIDTADLMVILLRFRAWPEKEMRHFIKAYERGIPIIALRTSTHPFDFPTNSPFASYNQFGKNVLGEGWVSHWGKHKVEATRGIIEPHAKAHPVLRGVQEIFGDTDVYEVHLPRDVTVLVRGQVLKGMNPSDPPAHYKKTRANDKKEQDVNDPMMPVVWTREHTNPKGTVNRILCTTMGSATDLQSEGLRRVLVNGAYWLLGLEVPAKADVQYVKEFKPTIYGFKGAKKGVRPADHATK